MQVLRRRLHGRTRLAGTTSVPLLPASRPAGGVRQAHPSTRIRTESSTAVNDQTTNESKTEPDELRDFALFLMEQRKGAMHADLTEAWADVCRQAMAAGKPATLTLTLKATPQGKVDRAVVVVDRVTTKVPAVDKGESLFFVDDQGNTHRRPINERPFPGMEG